MLRPLIEVRRIKEREREKYEEIETAKAESIQIKLDIQVRVQEMAMRYGSPRPTDITDLNYSAAPLPQNY